MIRDGIETRVSTARGEGKESVGMETGEQMCDGHAPRYLSGYSMQIGS